MKFFLTLSIIILLFGERNALILHDVSVPHLIVIDNENNDEPIKLDCEYELIHNSSFLVVKWYKDDKYIYQWIRGQPPSVFPHFKDHVGELVATSSNPNYKYRGLTLVNPSIDLSGHYKCLVQTEQSTASKGKELHVIDVSNYTLTFYNHPIQNETHLKCSIDNIYPKPTIHLELGDEQLISESPPEVSRNENGYFDVSVTAIANNDEDSEDFECFVTFDGLPFNLTANAISGCSGWMMTTSNLLIVFPFVVTLAFLNIK